jgi:hypothetical protein
VILLTGAQPEEGHPAEDGGPGPRGEAADDDLGLEITHGQMDAAVSAGDAIPLTLGGGWLTGYRGAWWVLSEIGWLCITDEATVADINHVAARLAEVAEDAGGSASAHGADLRSSDDGAEKLPELGGLR